MITMNDNTEKIGNSWAEKNVIAWLLEDWSLKMEYDLELEDFTDDIYRTLFSLLSRYNWDKDLVEWEIKKAWGFIEEERNILQSILTQYLPQDISKYVEILKNYTKKRNQIKIASDIKKAIEVWESEDKVLQIANKLYETETIKQQSREEIKQEIVNDAFWGDKEVKRFLVNYKDIDNMTWGFYPNQLITIAARPWIWKTMIAINFIANQLQVWHKVAFFSLEMSTKEIYQRLYARFWQLEVNKIKWSYPMQVWDSEKLKKAIATVDKFEENLVLYDDKHWLWEIVNQIRLLHSKGMLDIVYIDYVWLIEVKAENRNLEISKITRTLKMLAMQLKIPIVILAQLSRAVEKRFWGDEPILSDLRDSWSIEQDSDVVLMLHRMEDWNLKVLVRKNRNWPLWPCYQKILARYMQIWDMTEQEKQFYIDN
jgi:replicative DNA helicase